MKWVSKKRLQDQCDVRYSLVILEVHVIALVWANNLKDYIAIAQQSLRSTWCLISIHYFTHLQFASFDGL